MNNGYVISGSLFGDEGKGTFVDYLAHEKELIKNVRYNGGSQASHTVIHEGKTHKFSQLGSSMFKNGNKTYLSKNTIVNPFNLFEESNQFSIKACIPIEMVLKNIYVDKNAYVVTPYHRLIGMLKELQLKENKRGSVGTGVSQTRKLLECYNLGLQVNDLLDIDIKGKEKLKELFIFTREFFVKSKEIVDDHLIKSLIDEKDIYYLTDLSNKEYVLQCYKNLMNRDYFNIVDGIKEFYISGEDILFEGSQGLLIDSRYGIKPNTTFLDTSNEYAKTLCEEIGYTPILIGASRAFASRHGKGMFPTKNNMLSNLIEDNNQTPSFWQGSPIYGWYDAVLMRYSQSISKNNEFYLSGLDQLSDLETIEICNCYEYKGLIDEEFEKTFEYCKDNGRVIITNIKKNNDNLKNYLENCIPKYIKVKGWKKDIHDIRKYEDLPSESQKYIELIESLVDVPISLIGVGPTRDEKIMRLIK